MEAVLVNFIKRKVNCLNRYITDERAQSVK